MKNKQGDGKKIEGGAHVRETPTGSGQKLTHSTGYKSTVASQGNTKQNKQNASHPARMQKTYIMCPRERHNASPDYNDNSHCKKVNKVSNKELKATLSRHSREQIHNGRIQNGGRRYNVMV